MYNGKKIGVIIPVRNEEESIALCIRDIPPYVDTILCVDNGSTDRSYDIISSLSPEKPVIPLQEPRPGYGNACLKGMSRLTDEDIVVFLDADRSDDPGLMPQLLDPIVTKEADMVLSNRFTSRLQKGAMSIPQILGNRLSVVLIRLFWGHPYNDLGPFRAISAPALELLSMEDPNYGWTVEMQIKAVRKGLKVREIGLPYYSREKGRSKVSRNVRGIVRAGVKILFTIFRLKLTSLRSVGT